MHRRAFVGLRAAREGKWENARGQIFVALLPVLPCVTPQLRVSEGFVVGKESYGREGGAGVTAYCVSLGQLAVQWEGVVKGRLELRWNRSYLHSLSALPHRHTVSQSPDEMKSLIIEKNKMGLEEDPELLVKGESESHHILL